VVWNFDEGAIFFQIVKICFKPKDQNDNECGKVPQATQKTLRLNHGNSFVVSFQTIAVIGCHFKILKNSARLSSRT
jgi:hypothetical protein